MQSVMQTLLWGDAPGANLSAIKDGVRRDLEQLLNTRFRPLSPPARRSHLARSLLDYGLPDLATVNIMSGEHKAAFARTIQAIISNFEPRLSRVQVEFVANERLDRTVRFRIEALLLCTPTPEPVVFNSTLEPVLRLVSLKACPHG